MKRALLHFIGAALGCGAAHTADSVTLRERLTGVAFGNEKYLVVGEGGGIYQSSDLTGWRFMLPEGIMGWTDVAYGHGTFVAVGFAKSVGFRVGVIASSSDGMRWRERLRVGESLLLKVIFANEHFVAVGENGLLYYSLDGLSWTPATSGTTMRLLAATFGDGQFVVGGGSALQGVLLTSRDLLTWSRKPTGIYSEISGLAYGNGIFVAAAGLDNRLNRSSVGVSQDAETWAVRFLDVPAGMNSVAFGNGAFVAVGDYGALVQTTDAVHWTPASSGIDEHLVSVDFVGGRFIAFWDKLTHGGISSTDALHWERASFNTDGRPRFVHSEMDLKHRMFLMQIYPEGARRLLLESSSNLRDWRTHREISVEDGEPIQISVSAPDGLIRFFRVRMIPGW